MASQSTENKTITWEECQELMKPYVLQITELTAKVVELQRELADAELVEKFMLEQDDGEQRYRAYNRQGKVIDGLWQNDDTDDEEEEEEEESDDDEVVEAFDYEGKTYIKIVGGDAEDILDFATQEKIGTLVDGKITFDQSYIDEMAQE